MKPGLKLQKAEKGDFMFSAQETPKERTKNIERFFRVSEKYSLINFVPIL